MARFLISSARLAASRSVVFAAILLSICGSAASRIVTGEFEN
jgi:hypothetical protein